MPKWVSVQWPVRRELVTRRARENKHVLNRWILVAAVRDRLFAEASTYTPVAPVKPSDPEMPPAVKVIAPFVLVTDIAWAVVTAIAAALVILHKTRHDDTV